MSSRTWRAADRAVAERGRGGSARGREDVHDLQLDGSQRDLQGALLLLEAPAGLPR